MKYNTVNSDLSNGDLSDDNNLSDGNLSDENPSENYSESYSDNPYKLITRRIDSMKIRNNQKKELDVTTSLVNELDVVKDIAFRAGAIIYTQEGDQTYFCLGVDTQSGNITDFGGGVKKGETIIEGGLRELHEESLGIFGDLEVGNVLENITYHCFNMAIMFIKLDISRDKVTAEFKELVKNRENPEVCDIVWLSKDELLESIHGRGKKLYIRVRRLLNRVTNSISDL